MTRTNGRFSKSIAILLIWSTLLWSACSPRADNDTAPPPVRQSENTSTITRPERGSSPEQPAVNSERPVVNLADLVAAIEAGDYGNVDSLLIWKDGAQHLNAHFRGNQASQPHAVFSVTKSITSAAIGIALSEGVLPSLDTPLANLLPNYSQLQADNKQTITLQDALTMQTGLEWDETSVNYGQPGNDASDMVRSPDWVAYVLERELISPPGDSFVYSSGTSMLLSGILQAQTAVSAEDYVAEKIFAPLEITDWRWEKTRDGLSNSGWGLHLKPEDMLKLGLLFLNKGAWNGEQIIPEDWVTASTTPHLTVDENTSYGYQWWRFNEESHWVAPLDSKNVYFAWGFGGNFIWVLPDENAVIVATGENFGDGTLIFDALETAVFPWLMSDPPS